jgi:hypothetical protein
MGDSGNRNRTTTGSEAGGKTSTQQDDFERDEDSLHAK